jgi:hypothetical protein
MKKFIYLLMVIFLFAFYSCESGGDIKVGENFTPVKEIPAGKALVYLYRPTAWAFLAYYKISANGKEIITLPVNGYYPLFVEPGKVVFSAETEVKKEIALDAEQGKTYYLLTSVTPGFWVGHPYFKFVEEKEWLDDVAKYSLKLTIKSDEKK